MNLNSLPKCSVQECPDPIERVKQTMCRTHRHHMENFGETRVKKPYTKRNPRDICKVSWCEAKAVNLGLCRSHYNERKTGLSVAAMEARAVCNFGGCNRRPRIDGGGFCVFHDAQTTLGLSLTPLPLRVFWGGTPCMFPECSNPVKTAGMCQGHLSLFRRTNELFPLGMRYKREHFIPCGLPACENTTQPGRELCGPCTYRSSRYGLTAERYETLLATPRCPGCHYEFKNTSERHIDHDHSCCKETPTCGECTRGVLCSGCNVALGRVEDSVMTLSRLIRYLGG